MHPAAHVNGMGLRMAWDGMVDADTFLSSFCSSWLRFVSFWFGLVCGGCPCRWTRPPTNAGVKWDSRSKVEWVRLYITAFQGTLVCVMAVALERFSAVACVSSACLGLGLTIFGFGNQFRFEFPWNHVDIWRFHDDFHLLICATQVCTYMLAIRTHDKA